MECIVPAAFIPADLCFGQGDSCARHCLCQSLPSSRPTDTKDIHTQQGKAKPALKSCHHFGACSVSFLRQQRRDVESGKL